MNNNVLIIGGENHHLIGTATTVVDSMPCDGLGQPNSNTPMDLPVMQAALALYKAPFRYDRGYIWDATKLMVADDNLDGVAAQRVRGWGHIQKSKNAEDLQDAVGVHIAQAMTDYWVRHNAAGDNRGA